MGRGRWNYLWTVALGAAVAVASHADIAHAKSWAKWAPAPLASDSTYTALSARPADSLSASQFTWLAVQRDWRAQRDEEARPSAAPFSLTSPVTESRHPHRARRGDARFAALASRPYAALADSERTWLVAESAAQLADREEHSGTEPGTTFGFVILGALVGFLGGGLVFARALDHAH